MIFWEGLTRSIFRSILGRIFARDFCRFLPFRSICFSIYYKFYKYFGATHPDLAVARTVNVPEGYTALSLSTKYAKLSGGKIWSIFRSIPGPKVLWNDPEKRVIFDRFSHF